MVYQASVLYPSENLEFNLDYYLSTHMPLVGEKWGPFGLQKWEVIHFDKGLDGATPRYRIKAILTFESAEGLGKAVASDAGKAVFGDVPNFTNAKPVLLAGNVVGSATV